MNSRGEYLAGYRPMTGSRSSTVALMSPTTAGPMKMMAQWYQWDSAFYDLKRKLFINFVLKLGCDLHAWLKMLPHNHKIFFFATIVTGSFTVATEIFTFIFYQCGWRERFLLPLTILQMTDHVYEVDWITTVITLNGAVRQLWWNHQIFSQRCQKDFKV